MDDEMQENEIFELIVRQIDRLAARTIVEAEPKVLWYARYSTPGQGKASIERQSENIGRYAESIGITVHEDVDDRGVSTDE